MIASDHLTLINVQFGGKRTTFQLAPAIRNDREKVDAEPHLNTYLYRENARRPQR